MTQRGISIGSVLVLLSVLATLALMMGAVSFHHLNFTTHAQNRGLAKNLAESLAAQVADKVLVSPQMRLNTGTYTLTSAAYPPGSQAVVTFDAASAAALKIPHSTNNFGTGGTRPGALGRTVPENVLHLISVAHCADARYVLETQIYVPPFPSSLASNGPVKSRGSLVVGGLSDPGAFRGDYAAVPNEKKLPSHVASNSGSPRAVDLGTGARVEGNVQAVGGIVLGPGVNVRGEVRPNGGPQAVPDLDLAEMFARVQGQLAKDELPASEPANLEVAWTAQRTGDLTVGGDVILDGGLLYVTGNLTVNGAVRGNGAVLVGGETNIRAGAVLLASEQVALISQGPVTLIGNDPNTYYFQGLVYSEAEVVAKRLTVVGAIVARGLGGLDVEDIQLLNAGVTVNLVEGLEMSNRSDDDTTQIVIRVESRDPATRKPSSYKVQVRGRSDDVGTDNGPTQVSEPEEASGLRNYDEIKAWLNSQNENPKWAAYTKNAHHHDWYWNAASDEGADQLTSNPLRFYLDILEGKYNDRERLLSVNLDPNQALGVVERARVLLWRELVP